MRLRAPSTASAPSASNFDASLNTFIVNGVVITERAVARSICSDASAVSMPDSVPATLFALPGPGAYLIAQWVPSAGVADQMVAMASWDGSGSALNPLIAGAAVGMSLSADGAVQSIQFTGATVTMSFTYVRIA